MLRLGLTVVAVVALAGGAALAQSAPHIAGLAPSVRPDWAPKITEVTRDAAWDAQAHFGISEPYPASLVWLKDQGNWWTPFIHPGMTGHFDIRGWHAAQ